MEKKSEKILLGLYIIAFERVSGTYLYYEENSCGWQSSCQQTVLRSDT